jgi:hypothetical protein
MFFALMLGAPRSPTVPPRGATIDLFCIDGGRSEVSSTASQGGHRRCFLALMVGGLGSPASPPRGPAIDIFCIDGGLSRFSDIAS